MPGSGSPHSQNYIEVIEENIAPPVVGYRYEFPHPSTLRFREFISRDPNCLQRHVSRRTQLPAVSTLRDTTSSEAVDSIRPAHLHPHRCLPQAYTGMQASGAFCKCSPAAMRQ